MIGGLMLCILACARPGPPAPGPAWTRPEYVPMALLHRDPAIARYRQDWYARTLQALGEPSFQELARRPGQAYRFLWLRHWHGAVSVRISRVGDLAVADARTLSGRARFEDQGGRLVEARRVTLAGADWLRLEAQLAAAGFWAAPAADPVDGGAEGARWVFEGVDDGRVHLVDRFSPDDPALVELGLAFLALAGLQVPEREVY